MSPNGQIRGAKIAVPDNLYTVLLGVAFAIATISVCQTTRDLIRAARQRRVATFARIVFHTCSS